MLALELVEDRTTKRPAPRLAAAAIHAALEEGLLLLRAGVHSNCIRVLLPLTIQAAELQEALDAWQRALERSLAQPARPSVNESGGCP